MVAAGTPTVLRNFCARSVTSPLAVPVASVRVRSARSRWVCASRRLISAKTARPMATDRDRERAADPHALPCGRRPPAGPDEILMQIGRRVGVSRPAVKPALGGFKVCATKRRALAAPLLVPAPRRVPRAACAPAPRAGRYGAPYRAPARAASLSSRSVRNTQLRRPNAGGASASAMRARYDWEQPLAKPRALLQLPGADAGGNQIRADHEYDRIGRAQSAPAKRSCQGSPGAISVLSRKASKPPAANSFTSICANAQILARIRDEDLGMTARGGRNRRRSHILIHFGDLIRQSRDSHRRLNLGAVSQFDQWRHIKYRLASC